MYAGPLADKSTVVLLFNRAASSASITATWDGIILSSSSSTSSSISLSLFMTCVIEERKEKHTLT